MEKTRQNRTLSQHSQMFTRALDKFAASAAREQEFSVEYDLEQSWLEPPAPRRIAATYQFTKSSDTTRIHVTLADGNKFDLAKPVKCLPVKIPKQWGKEIWYSGIEARGESQVEGSKGSTGLATYLSLAPAQLHNHVPVTLIKVLDPHKGNLYLEVHEEKQEVYVVSHIDPEIWPEGNGGIRFGINQNTRANLGDDAKLREKFLAAAQTYEGVRQRIDAGEVVEEAEHKAAVQELELFTELKPLSPGAVVKIPTWIPHSLQKGVRVVEFQTPTFERYIIAASQKVVTQPSWDSVAAIQNMRLDSAKDTPAITESPGVERIATFDEFVVYRITVSKDRNYVFAAPMAYAFVVAMSNDISVDELTLNAEEVCFVPGFAQLTTITTQSNATCLITVPLESAT